MLARKPITLSQALQPLPNLVEWLAIYTPGLAAGMLWATAIALWATAAASNPPTDSTNNFNSLRQHPHTARRVPIGAASSATPEAPPAADLSQHAAAFHRPQPSAPRPIGYGVCGSPTVTERRQALHGETGHAPAQTAASRECRCGSPLYVRHNSDCPMAKSTSEPRFVKLSSPEKVADIECRADREKSTLQPVAHAPDKPRPTHSQPIPILGHGMNSAGGMYGNSMPAMSMFMRRYGSPLGAPVLPFGSFGGCVNLRHGKEGGSADVTFKSAKKTTKPLKPSTLPLAKLRYIEQAINDRDWPTVMELISSPHDGADYRKHMANHYNHLCGILLYYCGKEIEKAHAIGNRSAFDRWHHIQKELAVARNAWMEANKDIEVVCGLQVFGPSGRLHPFIEGTSYLTPYTAMYSAFEELMAVHVVPRAGPVTGEECPYCLESLAFDPRHIDNHVVVLPCGHLMCVKCAREVLGATAKCTECCFPAINDIEEVLSLNDLRHSPFFLPENAILDITMTPEQVRLASVPLEQQQATPTKLEQILTHRIAQEMRREGFGSDGSGSPNGSDNDREPAPANTTNEQPLGSFISGMQTALSYLVSNDYSSDTETPSADDSANSSTESDNEAPGPLRFYKSANAEEAQIEEIELDVKGGDASTHHDRFNQMICPLPVAPVEKIAFPPKPMSAEAIQQPSSTQSNDYTTSEGIFERHEPIPVTEGKVHTLESKKAKDLASDNKTPTTQISASRRLRTDAISRKVSLRSLHSCNHYDSIASMAQGGLGVEFDSPMSILGIEPGMMPMMPGASRQYKITSRQQRESVRHKRPPRSRSNQSAPPQSQGNKSDTPSKQGSRIYSLLAAKHLRASFSQLLRREKESTNAISGSTADFMPDTVDSLEMLEWSPGVGLEEEPLLPIAINSDPMSLAERTALKRQQARQNERFKLQSNTLVFNRSNASVLAGEPPMPSSRNFDFAQQ